MSTAVSKAKLRYNTRKGRYFARIQQNNSRRRVWFGTNRKEAEKALKEYKQNLFAGSVSIEKNASTRRARGDETDLRIEELAHEHLLWVKNNRCRGTFGLRQHYIKSFLKFVGPCMVSSITKKTISDFQIHLNSARRAEKTKTCAEHLRHIRTMFRWGEEFELCTNPVRNFPKVVIPPPKTRFFSKDEIERLLDHADPQFANLILFALFTGLRPQELRNLKKSDIVDDDERYLIIEDHKASRLSQNAEPRKVPLSDQAYHILVQEFQSHPNNDYVFLNGKGEPYNTAVALRQRLERLCVRAGVRKLPPYALRHTFATTSAQQKTNLTILGHLMGHSTTRTTQRYISNNFDYNKKVVDDVARYYSPLNHVELKQVESSSSSQKKHISKPHSLVGRRTDTKAG